MSDITTGNLRLVSQEVFDKLDAAYPGPRIEHDTSPDKIKWDAAQKAVVDFLKSYVGQKQSVSPTGNQPGRTTTPSGAHIRIGS